MQVRIVYFETAQTWADPEVLTQLGAAELYLAPLVGVEGIKLTSEYSAYCTDAGAGGKLPS